MTRAELQHAVRHLKSGGMVIYPTETSYGIGADATNPRAVRAIFKIKGRAREKSLPLIVGTVTAAFRIAHGSHRARELAQDFWPGPLTMVLSVRKSTKLVKEVLRRGTVALRVSSHPIAGALARALGRPLVATSANRAGKPTCYSVATVRKQLGLHLSDVLVIDGGVLSRQKPSTIVRVTRQAVEILRQGTLRI